MTTCIVFAALFAGAVVWAMLEPDPIASKPITVSCKPTDLVGIGRCSAVVGEMCCNVR